MKPMQLSHKFIKWNRLKQIGQKLVGKGCSKPDGILARLYKLMKSAADWLDHKTHQNWLSRFPDWRRIKSHKLMEKRTALTKERPITTFVGNMGPTNYSQEYKWFGLDEQ